MLSFKYEDLNFKVTAVQIGIIFLSTGLTVMNSIKSYFEINSAVIDITSIILTAMIGLITLFIGIIRWTRIKKIFVI